ncbi:hypothetical protein [Acinetobacter wuhouensis]|uniref:Uncharacterized protein n=1 Tax=Acinetobacter wuhouensis TaxID=1879050 RepID=A0A4Q7AFF3_9GAMM|nr:hypothetical protein [Acinetobacter wuhouensis]RZG43304.1 hypothetical protein EXU28_17555 [Acinetobacter wuhouensis]
MNRVLLSSLLFCGSFTSNVFAEAAPQNQAGINFIKKIYAMKISENYLNVDLVKQNSGNELKQLISRRDALELRYPGEMCNWVRNLLIPGNDFDVKLNQMKFTVLGNGLIRAQGVNFGEKFHIDYQVQCYGQSCKIEDIYDPKSYKTELISIIRKNKCY